VAERPMAHVVEEPGHAHRLLDECGGRGVVAGDSQRRIQMTSPFTCEVHRAEGVLEA
jgi:hypothetical protein